MTTPSTPSNGYFVNSEMWLVTNGCTEPAAWVEEGVSVGYEFKTQQPGYFSFWAYRLTNGAYDEFPIAFISPNGGITDEYQISRSPSVNAFNVYWNGTVRQTPDVGFWSADCPELGGEVYSNNGHADPVNMYSLGVNAFGQYVYWGGQGGIITDSSQLDGFSYQNSEWTWNTK